MALEDLTDESFQAAVREVIREERFFPPPSVLLDRARSHAPRFAMLPPARDAGQIERDREEAKRGVELIRQEWLRRTGEAL